MLSALGGLLAVASGIASLVFFVMVVMEMFKRDQKNLGIICIVLTFCTGIGPLIAFIFGWMKATEWNLKKIMTYWTVAFVVYFIGILLLVGGAFATAATAIQEQGDFDPNNMNFEFDIEGEDFELPEFDMPDDSSMPIPLEGTTDQP